MGTEEYTCLASIKQLLRLHGAEYEIKRLCNSKNELCLYGTANFALAEDSAAEACHSHLGSGEDDAIGSGGFAAVSAVIDSITDIAAHSDESGSKRNH
jgi:hypothetical protein